MSNQKSILTVIFRCWGIAIFLLATTGTAVADNSDITAQVQKGMALWNVPGLSVAIVDSEQVHFQKGFGQTAATNGENVDEHTLFSIASTTKAMVVSGILMLADEGKLTLDDLLIKHIPEVHFADPALSPQVTIRDLLAHRTGLPSTDGWVFLQNMPMDEQIRRLSNVDSQAAVRTRLIYQNTMYELAGLVIERLSGQRWDKFLTERLWHPIGMRETYGARGHIPAAQTHVLPHLYFDNRLTQAGWDFDVDFTDAAGSVWSSVHDMSLWAQFLLRGAITAKGERLISKEGVEAMFAPTQLASAGDFYPTVELTKPNWRSYGLGWFQQDFQGRKIDFHTGSLSGLIAIIGLDRANNKAMIVLGNRDHAEMRHALLWHVMDNSDEERNWNQEVFDLYQKRDLEASAEREKIDSTRLRNTKPSLKLKSYAGTYRNDVLADFVVSETRGMLRVDSGKYTFEMPHWHLNIFQIVKEEWDFRDFVSFTIGVDGQVQSMRVFGQEFTRVVEE